MNTQMLVKKKCLIYTQKLQNNKSKPNTYSDLHTATYIQRLTYSDLHTATYIQRLTYSDLHRLALLAK